MLEFNVKQNAESSEKIFTQIRQNPRDFVALINFQLQSQSPEINKTVLLKCVRTGESALSVVAKKEPSLYFLLIERLITESKLKEGELIAMIDAENAAGVKALHSAGKQLPNAYLSLIQLTLKMTSLCNAILKTPAMNEPQLPFLFANLAPEKFIALIVLVQNEPEFLTHILSIKNIFGRSTLGAYMKSASQENQFELLIRLKAYPGNIFEMLQQQVFPDDYNAVIANILPQVCGSSLFSYAPKEESQTENKLGLSLNITGSS